MERIILAAVAENGCIGKGGAIPWHFSEDLRRFKSQTMGHSVIMGRRTWESLGKPLKGRQNIVLSTTMDQPWEMIGEETSKPKEPFVVAGLLEACEFAYWHSSKAFFIGGAQLYRQALPLADEIRLTRIPGEYKGDVFALNLLQLPGDEWEFLYSEEGEQGLKYEYYRTEINQTSLTAHAIGELGKL